jgi:AGCS family alanine or glycine:cation symporter
MGASLQVKAVVDSAYIISGVPVYISSLIIGVLIFIAVIAGANRIQKITVWIIPIATIVYIIVSLCVIVKNFHSIPSAVGEIISSAFSLESCAGGSLGFLSMKAIKEGFSRGMLSNEAGAGTSSTAHIISGSCDIDAIGVMGIIEIFFDTVLLCTLTGLVILTSVPNFDEYRSGMALVLDAFTLTLGSSFGLLLTVLVFLFAYSTVICWYYYGTAAYCSVFSNRSKLFFAFLFLSFSMFGALFSEAILICITDFLMLVLSSLCLMALIKNSDRIKPLSERDKNT